MSRRIGSVLLLALLLDALLLDSGAWAQQENDPTFRAGTRLVQISVVAQDKEGKPVADLRREDFQVFDNGAPQEVRLFIADQPATAPAEPKTPGVFTNRLAAGGSGGYSVLLFDNVNVHPGNAEFAYTARARQRALLALREIPPNDKIAIYALGCRFLVVREFTSDRDSLIRQLETFSPAPGMCADPSTGDPPPRPTPAQLRVSGPTRADGTAMWGGGPAPSVASGNAAAGMAAASAAITADLADKQTLQLAEHLAGIPGRKNLLWLTTTFRLKPSNLRRLINANVALYPIDTQGSTIALAADKAARAALLAGFATLSGGVSFVDRDDLDAGIRGALNDGRVSYTLGFYQPDEDKLARNKAPAVHRIGVRVGRPGVALRYRASYTVEPPPPRSIDPVRDLALAMNRAVDATEIPLSATATRIRDRLDLSVLFDISGLDLQLSNGRWKGKAELVARFTTATAVPAGSPLTETITFNLEPATYAAMLQKGAQYHKQLAIPLKAVELKLLVGSLASGKIGTLTVLLSEVGPARP